MILLSDAKAVTAAEYLKISNVNTVSARNNPQLLLGMRHFYSEAVSQFSLSGSNDSLFGTQRTADLINFIVLIIIQCLHQHNPHN